DLELNDISVRDDVVASLLSDETLLVFFFALAGRVAGDGCGASEILEGGLRVLVTCQVSKGLQVPPDIVGHVSSDKASVDSMNSNRRVAAAEVGARCGRACG